MSTEKVDRERKLFEEDDQTHHAMFSIVERLIVGEVSFRELIWNFLLVLDYGALFPFVFESRLILGNTRRRRFS